MLQCFQRSNGITCKYSPIKWENYYNINLIFLYIGSLLRILIDNNN